MSLNSAKHVFLTLALVVATSCGINIYKPMATTNSDAAKKADALTALDKGEYAEAESLIKPLWEKDKTNEMAQLYAISMVGTVGLNIFSIISNALTSCQSSGSASCSGDSLISNLSKSLPAGVDKSAASAKLKSAVDVLNQAPSKTAITPMMCFVGGIYMNFVMEDLQAQMTTIQTSLKTDLASLGTTCSSGDSTAVGARIQASVTALGKLSSDIKEVTNSVGSCVSAISSGSSATNDIQKTLTNFESNADKGCDIPSTGTIGDMFFPQCMKDFLTSGTTAVAGDGKVDGCEIFVNCMSGTCL